jgi:carboxyl-terminal processing protease
MPKDKFSFKEHIPLIISGAVLAIALVFGGYYAGFSRGSANVAGTLTSDGTVANADYSVYWEAWRTLKANHVDGEKKNDKDLLYGSIAGLAQSYGDPHTIFFPPEDGKKFLEEVSGSFGGIGAEIGEKDGVISVVAPLKGSPAEKAGILAGDLILKIGPTSTEGLDVTRAVGFIRGQIGTKVTLNVFRREKWVQPKDIVITRDRIELPTLDVTYSKDNKIATFQLSAFNANAPTKFYQAATVALMRGVKGIVLDMRNNPGGYLEVANDLASWFVERGTLIVSERFRSGEDQKFLATGNGALKNIPIVILLNKGSASASEILAGALRDLRGAKIIGEKSYGKGTVQEVMDLKDGSSLKVTIAHWVMPSGKILDHNGIEPDYLVEPTDEEITKKDDVQLKKAIEVLTAQINGSPLPSVAKTK